MYSSPVRRSPALYCYSPLPLDLHVLGLPPAFTLSQDQTLHLKLHGPKAKLLQLQSPSSPPTRCTLYLRTNTLNHVICSNVC